MSSNKVSNIVQRLLSEASGETRMLTMWFQSSGNVELALGWGDGQADI